ncbi:MAG: SDR family oxidoreductase [Gammaproteobacteria bacterium]|nr:SDR family oxidoreductase [Gammaproteobacteria bacterium]
MKSRWNESAAKACASELELRAYSSRLLGADPALVLHGGGNTSVKGELADVFGESRRALFVKGSGWDLKSIGPGGFAPVDLDHLLRLARLGRLSDSEMTRELRLATLDPAAPNPSVEAILHALIPHRYVDHSHADAVVTLSNTPRGADILRDLYGGEVLVLPYIMPGFILARQVAAATREVDWSALRGIVLLQHGVFSFHDQARGSYEAMIEIVDRAERELVRRAAACHGNPNNKQLEIPSGNLGEIPGRAPSAVDDQPGGSHSGAAGPLPAEEGELPARLAELRRRAGGIFGAPMLARLDRGAGALAFASMENCGELIGRGPLTPDHTIHAKPFGAVFEADPLPGLRDFERQYLAYFRDHAGAGHQCLDAAPRCGVWRNRGIVCFAPNRKRLEIVADITAHTIRAIGLAEAIGGWRALPRDKLFEVEYWELEQAKLAKPRARPELEGKIALVTGAASGIGRATVAELRGRGAAVIALDIAEMTPSAMPWGDSHDVLPLICDVTDAGAVERALRRAVPHFGGVDILVSNAGGFPASAGLREMPDALWEESLRLNLGSHMKLLRACLPLLEHGFDPAVVFVGSKNVPAPGPGAAAYSAAKAGLAQLARVAALEAGPAGIRVNIVHPNAVFDTGIWSDEVIAERARRHGMEVSQYRAANVLGVEVQSSHVASAIASLAGPAFSRTTGAQIPVDGGNERVI